MNPDRQGMDPAYFLAVLIALVVIGGGSVLLALVIGNGAPHRPPACWWEVNTELPMGRELVCGTKQQHDEAKQHSYFITDYPGAP